MMKSLWKGAGQLALASSLSLPMFAAPERPNIILVMADDMGWGDPGYASSAFLTGNETEEDDWCKTPVLDEMAASGIRFDRFYAAAAVCSPTRASCLTGRNPLRVGIPWANRGHMSHDDGGAGKETPLSTVLSQVGYKSGHFGKWHLGVLTTETNDGNRGGSNSVDLYAAPWHFDYDACFTNESSVPTYDPYRKTDFSRALPTSFDDPNFYGTRYWKMPTVWNYESGEGIPAPVEEVNNEENGDSSLMIVEKAVDFMQTAVDNNEPFFTVIWFATPHTPLLHPNENDTSLGSRNDRACELSLEDMDTAMGVLRTALDNMGVRDNTMLWFTSDNGPENGADWPGENSAGRSLRSGRLRARKRSLYEGGIRVPGILEWPNKIPTGFTTNHVAVTSDYYSTILDYLDITVPGQKPLDGVSLRGVIEGTVTERTQPVGFYARGQRAWMKQQYKIVSSGNGGDDTQIVPVTDNTVWELYDIASPTSNYDIEATTIATSNNIAEQDQAIQDIFHSMVVEYRAWEATLQEDTVYAHSSQPTAALTGPVTLDTATFTVNLEFNEAVTGLSLSDFIVEGGTASNLAGAGTSYSIDVTATANGEISVTLPAGAVIDADSSVNVSSNTFSVTYVNPLSPDVSLSAVTPVINAADFTVDVAFTDSVTGLELSDFVITNGTATALTGSGSAYTLTVTAAGFGEVTVALPANSVVDSDPAPNNASNTLSVVYASPNAVYEEAEIVFDTTGAVNGAADYVVTQNGLTMTVIPESDSTDPDVIGKSSSSLGVTNQYVNDGEKMTFSFDQDVLLRYFDVGSRSGSEMNILTSSAFDGLTEVVSGTYDDAADSITNGGDFAGVDDSAAYQGILIPAGTAIDFTVSAGATISYKALTVATINRPPSASDVVTSILETSAIGSVVGAIEASDADGDTVTFEILSGNDAGLFAIDAAGTITTAGTLDYDTANQHVLTVQLSDGSHTSVSQVTIDVTEVLAPTVAAGAASNAGLTSADVSYSITDEGSETPSVTLYYGLTDGGQSTGAWDSSIAQGVQTAGDYTQSLTGLTAGTNYFYSVNATNSGGAVWSSVASFSTLADDSIKMIRTTVPAVSSATWKTVDLGQNYNSAVIIATPIYADSSQTPVVTRLRNVNGSSFELKVDRADTLTEETTVDVSVVVVEEGVYTLAEDGVQMEAVKATSTVTAHDGDWSAEPRALQNSYTAPVVVGQVMSANDPNWSVFWNSGATRDVPATATDFNAGKHVAEDPNVTRADEEIGYIVIESGSGVINGVAYEAGVGAPTVRGFGNSTNPYTYVLSGNLVTASAAAVSGAGMVGSNGGWAVLSGATPLEATSIDLHISEDQMADSERKHNFTPVGYLIFE